ncbi:MAG TPA: hypothetical protein VF516_07505, partial [Kofleriaceae bacterium]
MTRDATPPTPPIPGTPPALAADEAAVLLDRLIYEQVVACIDLEELHALEQAITLLAAELDGVGPDHAADLATAMIDAALRRLPDDVRRYLRGARWLFDDRCELCEDEARADRRDSSHPHRGTRPR